MTLEGSIPIILILLTVTLGPSFIIGVVGYASIQALGRNPSAASKIQIAMIFSFVFAEAIAIIALLVVFNLFK
ncbi:MAG: ATP synthase F0 subunit C [Planctomycetes bacterium]|nr:ATP synthase F0 subunit C [Planctomycetota bacterium]MCK5577891.1 ATP synthase F0 subunit C [Planctomycetota bacterium]